jgi:hypothetical protein
MKFRKKPVEIEAVRWRGYSSNLGITAEAPDQPVEISEGNMHGVKWEPLPDWLPRPLRTIEEAGITATTPGTITRDGEHLVIATLEGMMRADPGDWIIKGVKGEIYPCKPDIFAMSYDDVRRPREVGADLLMPIDPVLELEEAWQGWKSGGGAPGGQVAFRRLELAIEALVKASK